MFLLLSCILPVSNEDDTAVTGAGEQRGTLNDASFRLDWEQSEVWETGGCVEMDLTNQGLDASEWRVGVALTEEVEAWTWLDAGLSPDGVTGVSIIDTAGDEFEQGATLSTRYCSEPAALPTGLSVWAITGDDSQPDQIGGTIEDSTGRVWVSWSDSGQRGGVDCLEMSVINVSASDLPSWTIAMSLADDTELVEAGFSTKDAQQNG